MITVVCPLYNEELYIRKVLDFIVTAAPADKEVYLIDGGSKDATVSIIKSYQEKYPFIHLLHNPDKYVPFALNMAVKASKGDPIIRLDAHTVYADDYFLKVLETFSKSKADIVGGPMRATGKADFQKAVAIATSTPFGVGDSAFHDETHEGFVDSVYLGAWKRHVFERSGYFDVDMLRNQDDEFHYRAKANQLTIYLNPEIKSYYSPRADISSLFRQYYQYGLFKPLVLGKVKSGIRMRHLIPAGFACYLCLLPLAWLSAWILLPGMLYLMLAIFFALKANTSLTVKLNMLLVYPVLHIAYGTGFIKGLVLSLTGNKPTL